MQKYRKKPVVIEACQVSNNNVDVCVWMDEVGNKERSEFRIDPGTGSLYIWTLEGEMKAEVGDYVIRGVKGEFYPCKPDIFEATYEKVDE